MTKILHTADIHLDSPLKSLALRDPELRDRVQSASRTAVVRIVDAALEHAVAALLIAGDLYDGATRSARSAAFLIAQFDRLRAAGIPVLYIKGNHDAETPVTGAVPLPENVHVFDGRGGRIEVAPGVVVHGVSFSARHAPESLLPKFGAPVPGAVNIGMLHTSLSGAAGHDTYAPCSVAELAGTGFDYWALGHVHKRQVHREAPWIVMPGIPQGRDIGEPGPGSATLLEIGDEGIALSEIPTSTVEFRRHRIDATGCEGTDALRRHLRDSLREVANGLAADTAILRLEIAGAFAAHWQVLRDRDQWEATAQDLARETGTLWIESLQLSLTDPAERVGSASATDALAGLMETVRGEPGFAATARGMVEDVLGELSPDLRAELMPDPDATEALTRDLATRGAARIAARMRGAED